MKVWVLPLMPLEERYTEQWYRWFKETLERRGFDYEYIDGERKYEYVKEGPFLDPTDSSLWTFSQIRQVISRWNEVKEGDTFLIFDIEFPGHYEVFRFLSKLTKKGVRLVGHLHACTVTREDFITNVPWYRHYEYAWLNTYDYITVASHYFKSRIVETLNLPPLLAQKIVVTGNPWKSSEVADLRREWKDKDNLILYPNRFDWEKRPNIFLDIAHILRRKFPDWDIAVSTSRSHLRSNRQWLLEYLDICRKEGVIDEVYVVRKRQYYEILSRSKFIISTTIEENFGYCNIEAMTLNTIPIAPNDFAHPEVIGVKECLYDDYGEIPDRISYLDKADKNQIFAKFQERVSHYDKSIDRILDLLQPPTIKSTR